MSLKSTNRTLIERVIGIVDRITEGRFSPEPIPDPFYSELHQLEKILSKSNGSHVAEDPRKTKPIEPVSEQQKIMDMSG